MNNYCADRGSNLIIIVKSSKNRCSLQRVTGFHNSPGNSVIAANTEPKTAGDETELFKK